MLYIYSRAFRLLGIVQAQLLLSFLQRMPKITWAQLIQEGPAPMGYTARITSPHKLFSSPLTRAVVRKASFSTSACVSYKLNSVLTDICRKKKRWSCRPYKIGGGDTASLQQEGISSWIGILWVGIQPERPNNSPSAHKTTTEPWLLTSCLEHSFKLIQNTMGKKILPSITPISH